MKKVLKLEEPPALRAYREANPNATWENFKNECQEGHKAVQATLRQNQRNLCAYCENSMPTFCGLGHPDFRVEHFHPKKRPPEPPPNWGLDWRNLLGVCTGGNIKDVGETQRFTSPDHSCDVPKADQVLDDIILNPLWHVPAFPMIFKFDEQGGMDVDMEQCPEDLQRRARKTIEHLNLSPAESKKHTKIPRLIRFREAVIRKLRAELVQLIKQGKTRDAAMEELAMAYFQENPEASPRFFSCIRWYLGPFAEERLKRIGYNG
jgi:uncharacterized protein (TIGR02646 family)